MPIAIHPENMSPELIARIKEKHERDKKEGKVNVKGEPVIRMTKKEMIAFQERTRQEALKYAQEHYSKMIMNQYGCEIFVCTMYLFMRVLERDFRDTVKKTKYKEFGNFLADLAEKVIDENHKSVFPNLREMADYIADRTGGFRIVVEDAVTGERLDIAPFQK